MNVAPDRHHRFLRNQTLVLDGMLADGRGDGFALLGAERKLHDSSKVIAANPECLPLQSGGSARAAPSRALRSCAGPFNSPWTWMPDSLVKTCSSTIALLSGTVRDAGAVPTTAVFSSSDSSTPVSPQRSCLSATATSFSGALSAPRAINPRSSDAASTLGRVRAIVRPDLFTPSMRQVAESS